MGFLLAVLALVALTKIIGYSKGGHEYGKTTLVE
jgi:hypothetical protein